MVRHIHWSLVGVALAAAGCTMDEEMGPDASVGVTAEALSNGSPVGAGTFFAQSAVRVGGCSGVIVGRRDVLTASHCNVNRLDTVRFYNGPTQTSETRIVAWVSVPPGVHPENGDKTDINGKFADVAYVRLDRDLPTNTQIARMATSYPGNEVWGKRTGSGQHNSTVAIGTLYIDDGHTYSSSISGGDFLLNEADVDSGDSGGPFFIRASNGSTTAYEVQGVLRGWVWEWAYRSQYTSTVHHLGWIAGRLYFDPLDNVTFTSGRLHQGTVFKSIYPIYNISSAWNYKQACGYRCKQHVSCVGVNYITFSNGSSMCQLLSNISGTVPYSPSAAGTRNLAP